MTDNEALLPTIVWSFSSNRVLSVADRYRHKLIARPIAVFGVLRHAEEVIAPCTVCLSRSTHRWESVNSSREIIPIVDTRFMAAHCTGAG
jgi:hypothetical protein